EIQRLVAADPRAIGTTRSLWLLAADDVDVLVKGHVSRELPEVDRRITDRQLAGIWSATVGSFFMLLVTLVLSFPLGVATAIYLEEFAPRNRWTDLIE